MERIHVAVRARPLSAEDAKSSPWRVSSNAIFIPNHSSKFEFDRIFSEDCKTLDVYEARTKEIVAAAVGGFNGTVFAYGQTNSGKTFTMRGSAMEPGVIPLAVRDLFNIIHRDVNREFLLRMSYMEIYNEEINDLLAPEHRKLQIHENLERGIYVAGLREEIVASPEQVLSFMEFGESHRHIGETNMNVHSSRSHTIFRMIIESRDKTEDQDIGNCDAVRVSVLNLVDLAGSERAAKTGAEGVRLKEGSHINKSLMTLGTVIKKLSEGVESQGGHVPYRDSKLTRILQPALGGNANTAIICNITLAQVHADETRSSLQFASRALRVKNCAHVNEILTDAALLKRQKKEIEELRAKLQGSHSEHFEEEILNLRNRLLKTELERERIALELEEERKAQAEYEKRVQEQEKKIENLSSMVLCSNRDESRDRFRKEKRRDTWCAGNLSRETLEEVYSTMRSEASDIKPMRMKRDAGPLLPFEALMDSIPEDDSCTQDEDCTSNASEEYKLPDPCVLLHITNRRKVPPRKKDQHVDNELADVQAEYEDLFIKFESQRTESEIQIDFLTRKLAEADKVSGVKDCITNSAIEGTPITGDRHLDSNESETILVIKRLQEKINKLEMEKNSSQDNLASIVELATEQNICAREKFDELYEKLSNAREEARVAHEQLTTNESEENFSFMKKLLTEVQDIISEVQDSKMVTDGISSFVDDVSETFSAVINMILDFKTLISQSSLQEKSIISKYENLNSCLMQKVSELENQKGHLHDQFVDLQNQIEEIKLDAHNSEQSLRTLLEQQELEKKEYISYIQILEKEISSVSSCSSAKEKETLRKDLEKTKVKLKDVEFKLKNAMQEKTKIEGTKAFAEREIKRLQGQNSLLERDINRRESLAGRRHDSFVDKSSKMSDPKKSKGLTMSFDQTLQEYKKMEVYAFEMETKISSLGGELSAVTAEMEETLSRNEDLTSELEALAEKLNDSTTELNLLQEEVLELKQKLEENQFEQRQMKGSIKILVEEREELAMQLSHSLLEMEEEKAIWFAKEKATVEVIEEKTRLCNTEILSLTKELSEVRNKLESSRQECEILRERMTCFEEDFAKEKSRAVILECSREKFMGVDQLRNDVNQSDIENEQDQECECLKNELHIMTEERDTTEVQKQQTHAAEMEFLNKRCNDMGYFQFVEAKVHVEELTRRKSSMEVEMHNDQVNNKEVSKLKMRLKWTQAKLDAFRDRFREIVNETDHMNKKYEEAAGKLKERLASKGTEVLKLKKQLLAVNEQ
ncbi:kinesin-like protein KIN-7O isoform X3 [Humulus lupulus]|uniref:kinesin-like protein KIN-7O isoform X3 n=1 Tax=Humulus lupulus TaxID=3486 RepID=UPI002B415E96|nr:kinesin-like protein KIN-7O isoform X3 [Humulus lupulus]